MNGDDPFLTDILPQQRAALATYHLLLRSLAGLDGMTTQDVADLCGMCEEAARVMMHNLSAIRGVPIYRDNGRWILNSRN